MTNLGCLSRLCIIALMRSKRARKKKKKKKRERERDEKKKNHSFIQLDILLIGKNGLELLQCSPGQESYCSNSIKKKINKKIKK